MAPVPNRDAGSGSGSRDHLMRHASGVPGLLDSRTPQLLDFSYAGLSRQQRDDAGGARSP